MYKNDHLIWNGTGQVHWSKCCSIFFLCAGEWVPLGADKRGAQRPQGTVLNSKGNTGVPSDWIQELLLQIPFWSIFALIWDSTFNVQDRMIASSNSCHSPYTTKLLVTGVKFMYCPYYGQSCNWISWTSCEDRAGVDSPSLLNILCTVAPFLCSGLRGEVPGDHLRHW